MRSKSQNYSKQNQNYGMNQNYDLLSQNYLFVLQIRNYDILNQIYEIQKYDEKKIQN